MNDPINIAVVLESVNTRRDGTLKLAFGTNELAPQTMANIMALHNRYGFIAFKDVELSSKDIDNLSEISADAYDDPTKTPSKRLRGVFYRMYEKDSEGFNSFQKFYDFQMERVIEHFKNKLE